MFSKVKAWFSKPPAVVGGQKPVPFTPRGLKQPYFFLHIPKTSGSSWNAVLENVYGKKNFVEHAEYHLGKLLSGERDGYRCDGVSAHIPFNRWHKLPLVQPYRVLTVLRDPWARLVSHINWMDRFNNGKSKQGLGQRSGKIAHVANLIDQTDFEDRASLEAFREGLTGPGFYPAFDNLQVRMLYSGPGQQMQMEIDVTAIDAAVETLTSTVAFGFCEQIEQFQSDVLKTLGQENSGAKMPHRNKGPLRRVNVEQELAKEVLAPLFAHDAVLYDRAKIVLAQRIDLHGSSVFLPNR